MEHILKMIKRLNIPITIDSNPSLEKIERIQKQIEKNKEKFAHLK